MQRPFDFLRTDLGAKKSRGVLCKYPSDFLRTDLGAKNQGVLRASLFAFLRTDLGAKNQRAFSTNTP